MSTQNDFSRSFPVGVAMSAYLRVSISAGGQITPAKLTEPGIGILQQDVQGASWENAKVRFYGTGSCIGLATGGLITIGTTLFAATSGYVTSTPNQAAGIGVTLGTALETVSAALGTVEFVPIVQF